MSLITQLTNSDIPIVIILLGALFLYFGFIIGNTKVWKSDKIESYIEGLFFFVFYIFIPFIACFYLRGQLNVWSFLLNPIYIQVVVLLQVAVLLFQFVIFSFLSTVLQAQRIRRYEFVDTGRNQFEKMINDFPFIGRIIRRNENLYDKVETFFELFIYKIPIKMGNRYILFISDNPI
jgi:vacuolar-type H+-ATPase subunit I/STV1